VAARRTLESAMRAVDTNVLVRLVTRDDAKQAARADEFVANGAWVSHLVLAETTCVLSAVYERDASDIATAVEMLLEHEALSIADADVVRAALMHFRRKPALGFSDCLVLEVARAAGHLPAGTFDRELGKLAGAQRL
jgi:predicted nucleic-acid-binding protein